MTIDRLYAIDPRAFEAWTASDRDAHSYSLTLIMPSPCHLSRCPWTPFDNLDAIND
jgi:hypothetical protein